MQSPNVVIGDDGTPRSERFGDIYYSAEGGIAESRYVFLEQNELNKRFNALPANSHFTIAETGFGTGLNFVLSSIV